MSANPSVLEVIAGILAVVLPFWPLVVVSGFLARPQRPLWPMVAGWLVMLLCWVAARFVGMPSLLRMIPEPLNTVLFFATGVVIAALFIARKPLRLRM